MYATEKSLKELGDKIGQAERLAIDQGLRDLKDAVKSEDLERIKRGTEALMKASHKLAEEVYKKQAAQGQQTAPGGQQAQEEPAQKSGGQDDKVVDAEFKVEDDK
jgi:molecular chaperone DnaK